jgi:hypothetical protein
MPLKRTPIVADSIQFDSRQISLGHPAFRGIQSVDTARASQLPRSIRRTHFTQRSVFDTARDSAAGIIRTDTRACAEASIRTREYTQLMAQGKKLEEEVATRGPGGPEGGDRSEGLTHRL